MLRVRMSEDTDRTDNSFPARCRRMEAGIGKAIDESVPVIRKVRGLSFKVGVTAHLAARVIECSRRTVPTSFRAAIAVRGKARYHLTRSAGIRIEIVFALEL